MIAKLLSAYLTDYPKCVAYMWQASDYSFGRFFEWWRRVKSFATFRKRGDLVPTPAGGAMRATMTVLSGLYWILNLLTIIYVNVLWPVKIVLLVSAILLYPVIVVIMSTPFVGLLVVVKSAKDARILARAEDKRQSMQAEVIAVAGSYGKTSMKELLVQLLATTDKRIAYTPGNKNTLSSIARFMLSLKGDEDIVIIEYGEGAPGDIAKMVDLTHPSFGVITGLAPNHLDKYGTLAEVAEDIRSLSSRLGRDTCAINGDDKGLIARKLVGTSYSRSGYRESKVEDIRVAVDHTVVAFRHGKKRHTVRLALLGAHNVGPALFALTIALDYGAPITNALEKLESIKPYEHRMQPRELGLSWLIDDTYNGNIIGMEAGLKWLNAVEALGRKIYVTPGLVDQGAETERVHVRLGHAIAGASPDEVYLVKNSATSHIQKGLKDGTYRGRVVMIEDPLYFYTHIQDITAHGDVVLCQNDWPDLYA